MTLRSLTGLFIGGSWRTFAGAGHDELTGHLDRALQELGWAFTRSAATPTGAERVVFGAERSTTFQLTEAGLRVTVTSVGHDILLRGALRLVGTGDAAHRSRGRASIIDVRPIRRFNRRAVARLLVRIAKRLDREPWRVDHPRFRLAPLLRLKVRLMWRYWLECGEDGSPGTHAAPSRGPTSSPP